VLPGVNQRLPDAPFPEGSQYRRRFHKIRPGANHVKNMIHSGYFIRTTPLLEAEHIHEQKEEGAEKPQMANREDLRCKAQPIAEPPWPDSEDKNSPGRNQEAYCRAGSERWSRSRKR
jgi:hypothetical protein